MRLSLGLLLLASNAAMAQVAPGDVAPTFRLPVYNPKVVKAPALGLDAYVGSGRSDRTARGVLLSFFASHCAPCKRELPVLQRLHEEAGPQGLRVMLVAMDIEPEAQKQVAALLEQHGVTFPVLKDRFTIVSRRWLGKQTQLPSTFFVSSDGIVTQALRGYEADLPGLVLSIMASVDGGTSGQARPGARP